VYLLFVSAEADLAHTVVAGKKLLAPHLRVMAERRRYAHLVRCASPNPDDAVAFARRRGRLDETTAIYLLTRVGGDLSVAAGVCAKLALFDGRAGPRVVDQLCQELPSQSLVESLLLLRKRDALAAAAQLPERDYGRAVGLLDTRLDQLGALCRQIRTGHTIREITGVPHFLARQYFGVAKHYDRLRCARARRILAVIDDALRSGARTGVLEALIALW